VSVRAVSLVWERSRAKGSELLVLLAIADYAHDDGRDAWPSEQTLAAKSRMTDRQVRNVLRRLEAEGEIVIEKNADGRRVKDGIRPRRFIHVCCCEPEKISGSQGGGNRKPTSGSTGNALPVQPEKISGESGGETGNIAYDEPEISRTPLKEEPSVHPSGKHTARARRAPDGRRPHPLDERPVLEPWALEVFDRLRAIYPRLGSKREEMQAWVELNPSRELADFIVAHVQTRLRLGWVRDTPRRFIPFLENFIAGCRWQDRYEPPTETPPARAAPEGMTVMRSCPDCGATQEGRVEGGCKVFTPCASCAASSRPEVSP